MRRGISLGMRASCWQYWYSLLRERFSSVICRGCDGDYASCSCKLTCSTPFGTCAAMQEVKPKPSEHDLEIWTLSGPLFFGDFTPLPRPTVLFQRWRFSRIMYTMI